MNNTDTEMNNTDTEMTSDLTSWQAHVLVKACEALQDNESHGRYTVEEIEEAQRLMARLSRLAGTTTEP